MQCEAVSDAMNAFNKVKGSVDDSEEATSRKKVRFFTKNILLKKRARVFVNQAIPEDDD